MWTNWTRTTSNLMRSYETEYQFPLRRLNTKLWWECAVHVWGWGRQGTGDDDRQEHEGEDAPSSPTHSTFMQAQGALLTTNKSTARSNLSRGSVGRGIGVWGEWGRKGKRKRWRWKKRGLERKTEKVTRKEVNTHGPCHHTPSCCHRQLLHQLTGHFPVHHYIHRGQGQAKLPHILPEGPFHPWLDLFKWTKRHFALV